MPQHGKAHAGALEDARADALRIRRESAGVVGYGIAEMFDGDGRSIRVTPFANLITDVGDLYYASLAIVGVAPALRTPPTLLTGLQIGAGATAPSKSGAGGAMVTLLAGQAFDPTFPALNDLGAGLGVEAVYEATYGAGIGTGTVQEATVTNGAVGTASVAANTIARVVFSPNTKGAADSLAITWRHLFHG